MSAETLLGLDDEPALLRGYGPIAADLARDITDTASRRTLIGLFTDPVDGRLLTMDSTARCFTGRLRDFCLWRDQVCRMAGGQIREVDHRDEAHRTRSDLGPQRAGMLPALTPPQGPPRDHQPHRRPPCRDEDRTVGPDWTGCGPTPPPSSGPCRPGTATPAPRHPHSDPVPAPTHTTGPTRPTNATPTQTSSPPATRQPEPALGRAASSRLVDRGSQRGDVPRTHLAAPTDVAGSGPDPIRGETYVERGRPPTDGTRPPTPRRCSGTRPPARPVTSAASSTAGSTSAGAQQLTPTAMTHSAEAATEKAPRERLTRPGL